MLYHTKLNMLVIDKDKKDSASIVSALEKHKGDDKEKQIGVIRSTDCLVNAEEIISTNDINCVVIDPISFELDEASSFIFEMRRVFPEIVFVLYSDSDKVIPIQDQFYSGDRTRFHHYYKLNKKSKGKKLKRKIRNVLYLCIADIRLGVSLAKRRVAEIRKIGVPTEILESISRFNSEFADKKTAFIIMSFEKSDAHEEIYQSIKSKLSEYGIIGMRADDKEFHENLYDNILTYMYGCDFGVAVYERITNQQHNPNIAFETGYMKGLKKSVCILKDKTIDVLHADLLGKLYREFDTRNVDQTIDLALKSWLGSKLELTNHYQR